MLELLRDVLYDSATGLAYGESAASNVIIIWSCGRLLGAIALSPLLNHIPMNIIQFTSMIFAAGSLLKTVILISLGCQSYTSVCCLYFFLGCSTVFGYQCALEIAFEQTYPLDASFVGGILYFLILVDDVVVFAARQAFNEAGYIGPCLMQILLFASGSLIAFLYKPKLRRSLQVQHSCTEKTHLLSEN